MDTGIDTLFVLSLEPGQVIANLFIALLCGLIISLSYRLTSDSMNYSPSFVRSNVILAMITALVIMVIGNNLARAFGLVGAMSIIRFRTAVKDVQDIVYIFFSLAAGMAAGVGLKGAALVGTVAISVILLLLQRIRYAHPAKNQCIVQFRCILSEGEPPYFPVLQHWSTKARLANMRSLGERDLFELTFYIELKVKGQRDALVRDLSRIPAVSDVRLYLDDA